MSRLDRLGLFCVAVLITPWAVADEPVLARSASKTAGEFQKAFNAGNAKAVAALWTDDAEMIGIDGTVTRGRAAIEKVYDEVFKAKPGLKAEVEVGSVRQLGPTVAVLQGVLKLRDDSGQPTDVTIFRTVEVKEEGGWKLASVRSWVPDAPTGGLADLDWLVGDWSGKGESGEGMKVNYAWEEGKAFLRCKYEISQDGKVVSAGTQMIGSNPTGGARSWLFDRSGATAESDWVQDGDRWVIRAAGAFAEGSAAAATHILVPVGKDAFTWQSVDRVVDGVRAPDGKPMKLTRVAAK